MNDRIIYIADMDMNVKQYLKQNLEASCYKTKTFDNGEKLVWEINKLKPDLLIMDISLHGIDGLEVCRRLRQEHNTREIPILFLTDKKEEFDIVLGLEVGADDYMIKPFSVRELQSRIKALIRRTKLSQKSRSDDIKLNDLKFDVQGRTIYRGEVKIKFPKKEFELLMFMISNMGKILSREYLLEKIWGSDSFEGTRTVDVHIRYIRRKLCELDNEYCYIECVRKEGYRFINKKLSRKVG